MTAKKILRIASLALFMAIAVPASSSAIIVPNNSPAATENARTGELMQRLENIRSMDKSAMTRLEKKNLRKEVKGIKKEMKATSGGVYLSVGAVIIIILLLILIL